MRVKPQRAHKEMGRLHRITSNLGADPSCNLAGASDVGGWASNVVWAQPWESSRFSCSCGAHLFRGCLAPRAGRYPSMHRSIMRRFARYLATLPWTNSLSCPWRRVTVAIVTQRRHFQRSTFDHAGPLLRWRRSAEPTSCSDEFASRGHLVHSNFFPQTLAPHCLLLVVAFISQSDQRS